MTLVMFGLNNRKDGVSFDEEGEDYARCTLGGEG